MDRCLRMEQPAIQEFGKPQGWLYLSDRMQQIVAVRAPRLKSSYTHDTTDRHGDDLSTTGFISADIISLFIRSLIAQKLHSETAHSNVFVLAPYTTGPVDPFLEFHTYTHAMVDAIMRCKDDVYVCVPTLEGLHWQVECLRFSFQTGPDHPQLTLMFGIGDSPRFKTVQDFLNHIYRVVGVPCCSKRFDEFIPRCKIGEDQTLDPFMFEEDGYICGGNVASFIWAVHGDGFSSFEPYVNDLCKKQSKMIREAIVKTIVLSASLMQYFNDISGIIEGRVPLVSADLCPCREIPVPPWQMFNAQAILATLDTLSEMHDYLTVAPKMTLECLQFLCFAEWYRWRSYSAEIRSKLALLRV
jgi:hypothetical protein